MAPRLFHALREGLSGGTGPRRRVAVLLVLIVVVGVVLRCLALSDRSLWFDEAFSWRLTEFPLPRMLERVARDNHPPLYFLLLKGWVAAFGTSPAAMRSLSVLFGAATIAGAYLFTAEALRRPGTGLLAAVLVAVNVFQVRWGWEARMYSLGTALAVFSAWALLRALRAPQTVFRPWLLYAVLALLFAYTHYYALFTLAAHALFAAGYLLVESRGRPRAVGHALAAAGLVVLGWLPWLPSFLAQREQVRALFWAVPVRAWHLADACGQLLLAPENGAITRAEGLVAAGFCAAFLLALLWRPRAGTVCILLSVIGPLAAPLLLSLFHTYVFTAHYLAFAQVFLLIGVAAVLGRARSAPLRAVLGAWALVISLGASLGYLLYLDIRHKPGVRGAAAFIDSRRHRGEPVVVASPLFYLPILYYTGDRKGWYVCRGQGEVPHYEGAAVIEPDEVLRPADLRDLASRRVWAVDVYGGGWGAWEVQPPPGWVVGARHRFPEVYSVQGEVIVVEYQSAGPSPPLPGQGRHLE